MELTARMEYATLALVEMANDQASANDSKRPLHASAIAERQGIPRPYLDQLLLALRRAGLVKSIRGPKGGHLLARAAGDVSLRDIYLALEGDAAPRAGRRQRARAADEARDSRPRQGAENGLQAAWREAHASFLESLGSTTIAGLAESLRRSREDAMYYI